jgi:diaminopimelate epimerase
MARPFQTDYAGAWRGHCKTRESALRAAVRHVVDDGYSRATVTDVRTGEDVARVRVAADRRTVTIETIKPLRKTPTGAKR